ncbi:MAG: transcription initiation factor IIB [Thermoplasmatota archaeon]
MSNSKEGVDGGRKRTFYRHRKIHRRLRSIVTGEKKATDVEKLLNDLQLPSNVEQVTTSLYSRAVETHTFRGRGMDTLLAAAAYAACRQSGVPLTLDEIAVRSNIRRKEVGKTFRWLAHELQLKLRPASPLDYLDRFCQKLKTGECIRSTAHDILQRAEEQELTSGRGPPSMAAAAIYIASLKCDEKLVQRRVADVAGVTEVTVRNRYKELADQLHIDV